MLFIVRSGVKIVVLGYSFEIAPPTRKGHRKVTDALPCSSADEGVLDGLVAMDPTPRKPV